MIQLHGEIRVRMIVVQNVANCLIFWSDVNDKRIYKAPIDEGDVVSVVIQVRLTAHLHIL